MLTGNENIQTIARKFPQLLPEFEKHGLGSYFAPDVLDKVGKYTLLSSLLSTLGIDQEQFVDALNQMLVAGSVVIPSERDSLASLHFLAMLPCGLRNPFKELLEAHIQAQPNYYKGLNYLAEGNVNHEMSFYPKLDQVTVESELPDIIIASDVNNFFHRPFVDRFINKGVFQTYSPYAPNAYLNNIGFCDPSHHYTMLTANMLVMVVDKTRLGTRPMPSVWCDILDAAFANDIIMRGEDDFFCNAVLLPFFRDHGMSAIEAMARNIKSGKHPAEMVKLAGSGKPEAATVYIMPYFFAKKIQSCEVQIVWPGDGAIASPVFMLVKQAASDKHQSILNFLMSESMGKMLVARYFPSIHPDVDNHHLPSEVKWLGWDFLSNNDLGQMKTDIRRHFMDVWKKKR